jgi:chemotaxis protein methyltransferase CheR
MTTNNNLSPAEFNFVSGLVREKSAIVLETGKEYLVESRLSALARTLKYESINALVKELQTKMDPLLTEQVIEAMTTNETLFFRDRHPFEALQEDIIPNLIKQNALTRTLTFWCAASSSGQEPYSFCIMLREHFPELLGWRINFLATDISQLMLKRTQEGIYSQLEINRGMPARLMVKYFTKEGNTWQAHPELRSMIQTRQLNLSGEWGLLPSCDIVFIRNVLIYFDTETKRKILGKIRRILRPGGTMLLGGSETTIHIDDEYQRVRSAGSWVYKVAG